MASTQVDLSFSMKFVSTTLQLASSSEFTQSLKFGATNGSTESKVDTVLLVSVLAHLSLGSLLTQLLTPKHTQLLSEEAVNSH